MALDFKTMTKEEIMALPAGDDLDALVAANLMGYEQRECTVATCPKEWHWYSGDGEFNPDGALPSFSAPGEDEAACMKVFWKALELFGHIEFHADMEDARGEGLNIGTCYIAYDNQEWNYTADMAEAICKNALLVMKDCQS